MESLRFVSEQVFFLLFLFIFHFATSGKQTFLKSVNLKMPYTANDILYSAQKTEEP